MNTNKALLTLAAFVLGGLPLLAQAQQQQPRPRTSPHETISQTIDGNRVTIVYGRPYSKNSRSGEVRKVWGTLVPYGRVWRTGADEATLLITQQPLDIGGTTIPAGAYTLWTLPEENSAKLIINKQIGQWGAGPNIYDEAQDVARVDLKKEAVETPVDQFTMAIERNPSGGGTIKMSWENTQFSVPFTVKK